MVINAEAEDIIAAEKAAGLPSYSPTSITWNAHAENYLLSQGWERDGSDGLGRSLWGDPAGAGPKKSYKKEYELPGKDGMMEKYEQTYVNPCAWRHTVEDAYRIAKSRDHSGEESTQERLNRIGKEHDDMRTRAETIKSLLEGMVKRPVPEKMDGIVKELQHSKRTLYEVLALLK